MPANWQDLEKPMNCFTVRSATMVNLDNGKVVQYYSANTKIVVVQKLVLPSGVYYRTQEAARRNLNYAFEASAFGLSNEQAPSVHLNLPLNNSSAPETRTLRSVPKQKSAQKIALPEDGEARQPKGWLARLFRRHNG